MPLYPFYTPRDWKSAILIFTKQKSCDKIWYFFIRVFLIDPGITLLLRKTTTTTIKTKFLCVLFWRDRPSSFCFAFLCKNGKVDGFRRLRENVGNVWIHIAKCFDLNVNYFCLSFFDAKLLVAVYSERKEWVIVASKLRVNSSAC